MIISGSFKRRLLLFKINKKFNNIYDRKHVEKIIMLTYFTFLCFIFFFKQSISDFTKPKTSFF